MEKKDKTGLWLTFGFIALIYIGVFVLEQVVNANHIVFTVLKKGAIYSLVAVSMNLLNGFTGLFSLGQAGFMLIGAYTYAVLTMPVAVKLSDSVYKYYDCAVTFDTGILAALICAGLAAAIFAALIGLPVLRLKSDYLAIATLGFAEIIRAVFQWGALGPITNGANVLRSYLDLTDVTIPFTDIPIPPTLFVFIAAGICIAVIMLLINSSYGRAFKAIRDDEIAAEAMFQYTIQASQFKSAMTYEILLIVVIGGIGSVSGSCIASFLFISASEWWLRFLDDSKYNILGMNLMRAGFRKLVFSVIIMILVLFFSRGIMGDKELSFSGLAKRLKRKKAGMPAKEGDGDA